MEIQQLAIALIKTESRIEKAKTERSLTSKKLKNIIREQEECMALMQEKISRLEAKVEKMTKKEEKIRSELMKEEEAIGQEITGKDRKINDLQKRIRILEETHSQEKKDIIINMERDLQDQSQKLQKKHELKLNSLASINDQLNVKLQEFHDLEKAFEEVQMQNE